MEAMIVAGADVDQVDLRGGTALQVDIGDKQKILRQNGLIPSPGHRQRLCPPKAAREQGLKEMEELLLRSGAQS